MASHHNNNEPPIPLSTTPRASIFPPSPPSNPSIAAPFSKPSLDSMSSTLHSPPSPSAATGPEEKNFDTTNPFSAFYLHPTTRTSFEQAKSNSRTNVQIYEHDLEASRSQSLHRLPPSSASHSPERAHELQKRCTMWPARYQKKESRRNVEGTIRGSRACAPYRRLSKKQKLVVHILLAILVVGAATGLGIGISKAVGAGVWKSDNSTAPIGPPEDRE